MRGLSCVPSGASRELQGLSFSAIFAGLSVQGLGFSGLCASLSAFSFRFGAYKGTCSKCRVGARFAFDGVEVAHRFSRRSVNLCAELKPRVEEIQGSSIT